MFSGLDSPELAHLCHHYLSKICSFALLKLENEHIIRTEMLAEEMNVY